MSDNDTCSVGTEHNIPMYCPDCDDMVPENFGRIADDWKCPECGHVGLYEDKEECVEVLHAVARFNKEHGYGPWYTETDTDHPGGEQ